MNSYRLLAVAVLCGCVLLDVVGCSGGQSNNPSKLNAKGMHSALLGLPFKYKLMPVKKESQGNEAAFRGIALGKNKAVLHFSIGIGTAPEPVPLSDSQYEEPIGEPQAGFVFNDDSSWGKNFSNISQWRTAMHMAVEIEERLCKKATGQPCPV